MAGATARGIPYPTGGDPLATGDLQMKAMADFINDTFATGTATISGTALAAGAQLTGSIAHGLPWTPSAVILFATGTVTGSERIVVKGVGGIGGTNFNWLVLNTGTASATWTAMPVRWVALR